MDGGDRANKGGGVSQPPLYIQDFLTRPFDHWEAETLPVVRSQNFHIRFLFTVADPPPPRVGMWMGLATPPGGGGYSPVLLGLAESWIYFQMLYEFLFGPSWVP